MTLKQRQQRIGILFASPFLIGFILFFIAPFIISIGYTFTFGTGGTRFVGLQNYVDVFNSSAFQLASYNTFRFISIGVPLIMLLALVISLLLNKKFGGSSFFRSVFLYPLVIPIASTVMVFNLFFAESGLLNTLFSTIGIPVVEWLNSNYAFSVLVGLYIWKNCGYNIVLLLTGLNSIPYDFYEVARIEGATKWQQFRYITMPIMMPTFFFVFVISIINSFKCFREAFLLSGTLPHKSIYMLQHFMNNNFTNLNYQRLSVAAFLIFLVIFALIYVLFRMRKKAGDIQL
ncbi:sugar ABC transporter permease [Paludicola sp. MB14-C6]|uniref:carbohydrate ABC transporter permease n=1 Tax=Paludihabitans sp. MB14-C6 TaxID=3070656 RepID=UPI0027DBFF37|nr:sugar ABC transporter permease [Paludicola sp. MB14-C6]WMJ22344.1 sugar ABC transporter permease [Paludicola sp. MB14-C6]